jgi:hypothetical protein
VQQGHDGLSMPDLAGDGPVIEGPGGEPAIRSAAFGQRVARMLRRCGPIW